MLKKLLFLAFLIGALTPGFVLAQAPPPPPPSTLSSFSFTYEIPLIPDITSLDCSYARRSGINNNLTAILVCFGLIGNRPSTPPENPTGVLLRSEGTTLPDGTFISRLSFSGSSRVSNIAANSRLTNVLVASFDELDLTPDVTWVNFNSPPPDGAADSFFFTRLQTLLTKMAPLTGDRTAYKEINVQELPGLRRASPPPAQNVSGIAKGDCNGDGEVDVIVPVIKTTNAETVVSVLSFIQKGRGWFFSPQRFDLTFTDPDGSGPLSRKQFSHGIVRIADFDGDDHADYALLLVRGETDLGTAGGGELYVIYGVESTGGLCSVDAPSSPPTPAFYFGAGNNPAGLAIADFDNDGMKDFAVLLKGNGGTAPKGVQIFYNDGLPALALGGPLLVRTGDSPTLTPEGLAIGDFDNDGRMDVAFGDSAAPRFYYARNKIGVPGAVGDFSEVKVENTGGQPVEDIKFLDADFCYGDDILVLHKGNGGNAKLSVHGAKRPGVTLTFQPSPEVSTTAGKPVTVRANLTNRDKVNPAFKWIVAGGPTDPPLQIMNQFAADPTFTAFKPGEYRVKLSVDFKPNFKKYGERTPFSCPGGAMKGEIIIRVGPAEEVGGATGDTPTPAFSPDQIVPPGGRACFFCGAPRSGVHQCSAEQTDGPEVAIECSERFPTCCFDVPADEPEEGVIAFSVTALDFEGSPIVSAPVSTLLFQEAEEEEEEEEESSTTSQTMTFLVSEEAPISEVTASITGSTETVTSGGTASYSLTGECSTTDEGTTTTASWYAEDPDDLVVDDSTAAETSYVKYLSGETELTLLCSATDDDTGSTLVSEPASMTIMGLTTEEEFAAGNALGGGCSLVK